MIRISENGVDREGKGTKEDRRRRYFFIQSGFYLMFEEVVLIPSLKRGFCKEQEEVAVPKRIVGLSWLCGIP